MGINLEKALITNYPRHFFGHSFSGAGYNIKGLGALNVFHVFSVDVRTVIVNQI